jgi:hypothetical protein
MLYTSKKVLPFDRLTDKPEHERNSYLEVQSKSEDKESKYFAKPRYPVINSRAYHLDRQQTLKSFPEFTNLLSKRHLLFN